MSDISASAEIRTCIRGGGSSMANGNMGRKTPEETKQTAFKLLNKGVTVPQIASRIGVSKSLIRNWIRDSKKQESK